MSALTRFLAWMLALALVALPLIGLLNGWFAAERWPLRRLLLTAEFAQITPEQIREAIQPHLGKGFFAIELQDVQTDLQALPWVERVEVRKRWPDGLEIQLRERRAVARWGEGRLLSDQGILFTATILPGAQDMPEFDGPDTYVNEVVALYRDSRPQLAAIGLSLRSVAVSARGSWTFKLDDGGEIALGRGEPRPRLLAFTQTLPQLLTTDRRVFARADLRYSNGFAIAWLPAADDANAPDNAAPSPESKLI